MIAVSRAGAAMGRLLSRLSLVAGLLLVASPAVSQSLPSGNPATPEQVRFYHSDALGSVRAVTDIDGEIVSRSDYLPFGEQIPADLGRADITGYSEDAGNKHKFTGKERDGENGLDYFGARYLSGAQGRFTSVDPDFVVREHVVDPQQWNRYSYVRNNPLKYTDPDGRVLDTILDVGFILYDLYDIASTVVSGESVSGTQIGALGADVLGAAIPFATGGGAAVRAAAHSGEIVHGAELAIDAAKGAERIVDAGKAAEKTADVAKGAEGMVGSLRKPPTGKGRVSPSERDPKRLWTPDERAAQREAQAGECATGCGTKIDQSNSRGHHKKRHADGGQTDKANHAEVCIGCHDKLHAGAGSQ